MTARWIVLEGGEGSGKSTQAALLASSLGAVLTREPGGTSLGSEIRAVLLSSEGVAMHPRTEALLMAADRAEHFATVVGPALERGGNIVSDRSVWSSLAYQGYGRGLDLEWLRSLSDWAMGGRWPDLAVLVDVPPEMARTRVSARGARLDRLEAEEGAFHDRVREGFSALAASEPERWVVVDGSGTRDAVAARVSAAVAGRLGSESVDG